MKRVPVSKLIADSYVSNPIYLDDGYILITSDIPVTRDLMLRLQKWGFSTVLTEGEDVAVSGPTITQAEADKGILGEAVQEKEKREQVQSLYYDLIRFAESLFKDLVMKHEIDIAAIASKVKDIIEMLKENSDYLLSLLSMNYPSENYLVPHVVNSTILAVSIGDYLNLPPHKLIELGNAAFLHEMGMIKIPSSLYLSKRVLNEQEKKTVTSHTVWGYKILKSLSIQENIATTALEHHERMDGSGYPRKMSGNSISLFSRIVAVTCSFDACISKRPYKSQLEGHGAMLDLLSSKKTTYDENVLKALVYKLSIFPLGNYVLLSNKSKGIVYKTNSADPRFPFVKIVIDEMGNQIENHIVVPTSKQDGLFILKSLKEEEVGLKKDL
ncbi:MAG: HD domain-containing protein [Spirochaetales bacterium]|nr:HD domain-containing protein [Spirochaetales bacterium]